MDTPELHHAKTIWELVDRRADLSPDHPMLFDSAGRTVTFGEFRDLAESTAAGLLALGVDGSTRVSWQLPTSIEAIALAVALSRLSVVQNPIIHLYKEREIGFALSQTGSAFFFVPGSWNDIDFVAMAERAKEQFGATATVVDISKGLPKGDPATLPDPPAGTSPDQAPVRWIYYTSGSTAEPKGVQHTDQTLIAGGWGLARALDMSPGDVGSIAFPFSHIAGPDYLVTMLTLGFPAILLETFSPVAALEVFNRYGATMVGGSTAFYVAYLTEQRKDPSTPILPTIRLMSGGGAAKPPNLHAEVRDEIGGRGVVHGYGMTEVPMIANGSPHDTDEQLANTDGAPVEGAEVRIVALDGSVAQAGQEGEIRVKGPMVFRGYTNPDLDKDAFDEDGWFRTGDLGIMRADGHLSLTGRLKDVIVRKGENISAREVEDLLSGHPKVGEIAVIGIPDATRGEMVCAVVLPSSRGDLLTFDEMVRYCRDAGLMTQKIPERLEIVEEMPRAGTGKIVKKTLKEIYSS
jgi:acyl-CoA synthetase (AMP-forming)/AMP-acid ligase II